MPYMSSLLKIATSLMKNLSGPCILKELANKLVIRLLKKTRRLLCATIEKYFLYKMNSFFNICLINEVQIKENLSKPKD